MGKNGFSNIKIEDWYATLGVDRQASDGEIREAYHKLAKLTHPDTNSGDKKAEELFKKVSEAYDVLSDPVRRENYDRASAPKIVPYTGNRRFKTGNVIGLGLAACLLFGAGVFANEYFGLGIGTSAKVNGDSTLQSVQSSTSYKIGEREHKPTIRTEENTGSIRQPDVVETRAPGTLPEPSQNALAEPAAGPRQEQSKDPGSYSKMAESQYTTSPALISQPSQSTTESEPSAQAGPPAKSTQKTETTQDIGKVPVPVRKPFNQSFAANDYAEPLPREPRTLARLDSDRNAFPAYDERGQRAYNNYDYDRERYAAKPMRGQYYRRHRIWNWYLRTHCQPMNNDLFRCEEPSDDFAYEVRQSFRGRGRRMPFTRRIRNAWLDMKEQLCSPSSDGHLICERP